MYDDVRGGREDDSIPPVTSSGEAMTFEQFQEWSQRRATRGHGSFIGGLETQNVVEEKVALATTTAAVAAVERDERENRVAATTTTDRLQRELAAATKASADQATTIVSLQSKLAAATAASAVQATTILSLQSKLATTTAIATATAAAAVVDAVPEDACINLDTMMAWCAKFRAYDPSVVIKETGCMKMLAHGDKDGDGALNKKEFLWIFLRVMPPVEYRQKGMTEEDSQWSLLLAHTFPHACDDSTEEMGTLCFDKLISGRYAMPGGSPPQSPSSREEELAAARAAFGMAADPAVETLNDVETLARETLLAFPRMEKGIQERLSAIVVLCERVEKS